MDERTLIQSPSTRESNTRFPLSFHSHDGWFPLLRIPAMLRGVENPYFDHLGNRAITRIREYVKPALTGFVHNYKIRGKGITTIYSGLYSVMGISTALTYLPSSLRADAKFSMNGVPDIFCIGVVKANNLPKFKHVENQNRYSKHINRYTEITYNAKDVTILISIERLRKTKFTTENYSKTVRNEILYELEILKEHDKVKLIDVPEEYLRNFYTIPKEFTTNSIVEMMNIESSIKTEVFSNLNLIEA